MGWATGHIDRLLKGETIKIRPHGNSMSGKIESGQLVTIEPVDVSKLCVGDIVLCKVNGNQYLHLIKAVQGNRFLIANNRGRLNGWTSQIFGRCIKVEN